jgi:hypothetical protein
VTHPPFGLPAALILSVGIALMLIGHVGLTMVTHFRPWNHRLLALPLWKRIVIIVLLGTVFTIGMLAMSFGSSWLLKGH